MTADDATRDTTHAHDQDAAASEPWVWAWESPGGGKSRFSTQVADDVQDDVRATVAALQRILGPHVSLSAFTTEALRMAVAAAQEEWNEGKPFDAASGVVLPRGRRLGEAP